MGATRREWPSSRRRTRHFGEITMFFMGSEYAVLGITDHSIRSD
jgi:hypothetical protein